MEKLVVMHFAEPITDYPPVGIVMRVQLVNKSKTEKRATVNGSVQKKCMRASVYPMPQITKILHFVASFEFRAKIDLKHAYHNLEVHPDDIYIYIYIYIYMTHCWMMSCSNASEFTADYKTN